MKSALLALVLPTLAALIPSAFAEDIRIELDTSVLVCIADDPIIGAASDPAVESASVALDSEMNLLANVCTGKPKKPAGGCYTVCKCTCGTVNGNEPIECWVPVPKGTVPNQSQCPASGPNCSVPATPTNRTGNLGTCRT